MNRQAAALMKQLELDVDVTRNLEEYSLALQQMVAIARAVEYGQQSADSGRAHLITGRQRGGKAVYHDAEPEGKGRGIIFVTHFLEQVYAVCDGITVLRNGTLVVSMRLRNFPE